MPKSANLVEDPLISSPANKDDTPGLTVTNKTNFEDYAQFSPHFFARWDYPNAVREAIDGRSGVYLEIGAGDGAKLRTLINDGLLRRFNQIIATDISAVRVATIRTHVEGVEASLADAQDLPFADCSIDFILSDQVIEHVPDDNRMAAEISRVLRPGGYAYVGSVIKLQGGFYFYRHNGEWRLDPTHVREYTSEAEFRRLFEIAGLRVVSTHVSPVEFSLTDLSIRFLLRFGLLSRAAALDLYAHSSWFAAFRQRIVVRIPRYRIVGAVLQRV